jgi:hypothetical protein
MNRFTLSCVSSLPRAGFVVLASLACVVPVAMAQNAANVTIDLAKPVNILTDTAIGYLAPTYDANSFQPAGAPYLRAAGVTTLRFPGNHGAADLYHWSTKSLTKYKGFDAPYLAPESNFGQLAPYLEKLGNAVIEVNYGSNLDGTGGGDPGEAAAWVAYANGDTANTAAIASAGRGTDWHTVGFWATLRGQSPLAEEDGLNFLRIGHPAPFHIRLWQVGDQLFNNGFFGADHAGDPDLHGPVPTGPKDLGRLRKDAKLSAAAYAENFKVFAAAMKAVDPSILVGAGFTTPPDGNKSAPDWNFTVLKGACASIDFVSVDWENGNPTPPDYKQIDAENAFSDTNASLAAVINTMLDDDKHACPQGHIPRIAFSSAILKTWLQLPRPEIRALWIADVYSELIETGGLNADWNEAYGDEMMSGDRKRFGPAYYGLQMLHIVAHKPGDAMLEATSSSRMVSVHAARRTDGILGILLVNKDPKQPAVVKISLKNGTAGTTGKRFDYGTAQFAAGAGPAATAFSATGSEMVVTVPPYTVTDLLLVGK